MNKLGYYVFKNSGVKIDLDNFNILPYDDTFGSDTDIVNITFLPWWDLADITDNMNESDKKAIADILKQAHKIKTYVFNALKDYQKTLKGISDFDITDDMVIELMALYNLSLNNIGKRVSIYQVADIIKRQGAK
jgi:hypothetical protein